MTFSHRFILTSICCYVTTAIVYLGMMFGFEFVPLQTRHVSSSHRTDLFSVAANWDGEWYARIATKGYSYDQAQMSSVVFFPAYPILVSAVQWLTGVRVEIAMLIVSNAFLFAAFYLLARYVELRYPDDDRRLPGLVLLSLGLYPLSLFFRVGYSESMFLFFLVWSMDAMERERPSWLVALIAGTASAVRPVGICLIVPFIMHLWNRKESRRRFVIEAVTIGPLCAWGLLAYLCYLAWEFDEPMAFVNNQRLWVIRPFSESRWDDWFNVLSLQPIRDVYDRNSISYWSNYPPAENPFFNLHFANPIYLTSCVGLVLFGYYRAVLNSRELALSLLLLLIPYALKSYSVCMMSQARYTSVVFPVFIVVAKGLVDKPKHVVLLFTTVPIVYLFSYSALFAAWYWIL